MHTPSMTGRDVHLRLTDTSGHKTVRQHRVWCADTFLAARAAEADKLNREVKGEGPRLAKVEVITAAEYAKERT
jgi:hypothetical protein